MEGHRETVGEAVARLKNDFEAAMREAVCEYCHLPVLEDMVFPYPKPVVLLVTGTEIIALGAEAPLHCCATMPKELQLLALRLAGAWCAAVEAVKAGEPVPPTPRSFTDPVV